VQLGHTDISTPIEIPLIVVRDTATHAQRLHIP
jgi:hypothetical protein